MRKNRKKKGQEENEKLLGVYQIEISTGKRLNYAGKKSGKVTFLPPEKMFLLSPWSKTNSNMLYFDQIVEFSIEL